ncbi:E3 ubiquitin-protein ligase tom1 [Coniosporium tulheliwenetii]|uniref:E3 ubiquitin-protein ligase tom1 n=1 Tax=Coniosporium tulheliwenetii TaxID=3383036 RepID=A0ACC2ZPG6_9PEZI|nr:E3 ubiquitin-protein ligase tom1 [Cladosporium sp. JES 115]
MGRIKKSAAPKHGATLSPYVADFIEKTTRSIPLHELPAHLASFPQHWPFPRGDLYHWIPVLNRFDNILERFVQEYGLTEPQTQPFERRLLLKGDEEQPSATRPGEEELENLGFSREGDRELIEQILSFTRLLLENCGNRSLYSSSSHLNNLLHTTSLSLLKSTLRLSLRLAQRYHASRIRAAAVAMQPSYLASHYDLNLDRVLKLAQPFVRGPASTSAFASLSAKGKETVGAQSGTPITGPTPSDLVSMVKTDSSSASHWEDFGNIHFTYYDASEAAPEAASKHTTQEAPSSASPVTPTPLRRTTSLGPHQTPRQTRPSAMGESPSTKGISPGQPSTDNRPSGPKALQISPSKLLSEPPHEILSSLIPEVPPSMRFDLLQRVRVAHAIVSSQTARRDIVAIRLLAIANLAYVYPGPTFQTEISQQDSDEPRRLQLTYQLSELVHPPAHGESSVPRELQTLALETLEALTKHKEKAVDVSTALSVNVNHGVLFYVVRKAVAELSTEESSHDRAEEDEWREALFSLLNSLPGSQARLGESMVAAGLLEILVEVLTLRTHKAERTHPKVLNFLDMFVYNLRDAFQALVNAKGLDIIADLTAYDVETSYSEAEKGHGLPPEYKTQMTDYKIPFYKQQTLRLLFKFMNHMITHASGNSDRAIRNLIDSPQLLRSLRTVLGNALVYGSTVWSMTVSILSNFIHQEPTSYNIIAEAGLSKGFLEAVTGKPILDDRPLPTASEGQGQSETQPQQTEPATQPEANVETFVDLRAVLAPRTEPPAQSILPVAEAITTIPQTFGAICLNESGMKLFTRSGAMEGFLEVFESPEHVKVLEADAEAASVIGGAFDELARHHPRLRGAIVKAVSKTVARVVQLCFFQAAHHGAGAKLWVDADQGRLKVAGGRRAVLGEEGPKHKQARLRQEQRRASAGADVVMQDANAGPWTEEFLGRDVFSDEVEESTDSKDASLTTKYVAVLARFLTGLFNNNNICADFASGGALEYALDLTTLPSLPYNFGDDVGTSDEVGRVIQFLVDAKPHLALPPLLKRALRAVATLEPFLKHEEPSAFFSAFTTPSDDQDIGAGGSRADVLNDGTRYVKALVNLHTICNALTMTMGVPFHAHRSAPTVFQQVNVADMYCLLINGLGRLQRSCVWEEILLQRHMPKAWETETRIVGTSFGGEEADDVLHIQHGNSNPTTNTSESNGQGSPTEPPEERDRAAAQSSLDQEKKTAQFKNTKTLRYLLSQVPIVITNFFQGLGKVLLSRRGSQDSYMRQNAQIVADELALSAINQLKFELPNTAGNIADKYAYQVIILTSTLQIMLDTDLMDRAYPQTLTLVLQSFKDRNGFEALADILGKFIETLEPGDYAESGDTPERRHARTHLVLGGIKVILEFYSQVISSKHVSEAPQTQYLSRNFPDRGRAEFFSASQFLVEVRAKVVKQVQRLWTSNLIDKATTSVVKNLIEILKIVLEGDAENGAFRRAEENVSRKPMELKPWKSRNPDTLARLKAKGFDEELALEALFRCYDNFHAADEYCIAQKLDPRASRNPVPASMIERPPKPQEAQTQTVQSAEGAQAQTAPGGMEGSDESNQTPSSAMQDIETADSADPFGLDDPFIGLPWEEPPSLGQPTPAAPSSDGAESRRSGNVVTIEDLDEDRSNLRATLIDRSLDILTVHDDVTFDLSELIFAAVPKGNEAAASSMRGEIGSTLLNSLISLQTDEDLGSEGKKIAAYAHLLALVLQDKRFYEATLDELKENFENLLSFIRMPPEQRSEGSPQWIGQVLLILERLLAEDAQPNKIDWTPTEGSPQPGTPIAELPEPLVPLEQKMQLFSVLLEITPRIGKDESLALSVIRVFVILTRNRQIATQLAEKRNIQRLFLMVKQLAGSMSERIQSSFMIVLRHIIEDDETIRQIMRSEIQAMFRNRNARQTDTTAYVRQTYHLALRAPEIFVKVTNETLMFARYDSRGGGGPQILALKKEDKPTGEGSDAQAQNTEPAASSVEPVTSEQAQPSMEQVNKDEAEKLKAQELKHPVVENPDGVIHYLLCELLTYKDVEDKEQPAAPKEPQVESEESTPADIEMTDDDMRSASATPVPTAPPSARKSEKPDFKADQHPIFVYRCFILQCLTELLSSYNRTKIEFINFSRKADPHAMTPSKPRSGILNYFLNALIPVGTLSHPEDITSRKKSSTSNWAISVLVSLCERTSEAGIPDVRTSGDTEDEPELAYVRRFVLEHALKAFRDASTSSEPQDMKYSRLLNLADMFHRMLTNRNNSGHQVTQDAFTASQKQLAKMMYDKNFITVLTLSIADIDLNFPGAKRAVKYILRPLKLLTKAAYELSLSGDISSSPGQTTEDDEISTATSVSDDTDDVREETPDLFRNSALGMLEPGREEESDSTSDDDDDEDMYEEDYGEEMEYEEEMGHDNGEVVSDEEEEIEAMGDIEGLPGDVDMTLEIGIDDEEIDGMSEEGDEDDDEEDDDGIEVMEEVTGDDEDGSPAEGDDDDWASEDEEEEDYPGQDEIEDDQVLPPPLPHIVDVIQGNRDIPQILEQLEHFTQDDVEIEREGYMDDEMAEEDEDEDDEEEYDDEEIIYEPDYDEDEEGAVWARAMPPPGHRHHHHIHHHRGSPWTLFGNPLHADRILGLPNYRSHRPGGAQRPNDDGVNPLLQRSGRAITGGRRNAQTDPFGDWVYDIDPIRGPGPGRAGMGEGPVSVLNNLLSAMSGGAPGIRAQGGALTFTISGGPPGSAPMPPAEAFEVLHHRSQRPREPALRPSRDDPAQVVAFVPLGTSSRWQEEARILFGSAAFEKATRVVNSLMQLLVPPAIEAAKKRAQEEAERRAKERKEREEREEKERKEREEREAREAEEKKAQEAAEQAAAAAREQEEALARAEQPQDGPTEAVEEGQSMEGVEQTQPSTAAVTAEAGPAEAQPRITTTLRGRELDITGMGIDLEYLEALPDDLREEVLMAQVAEQRSQAAAAGEEPTDISREFLEALPAEIREELLQQEAQDRRRREREEARRRAAANGGPAARAEEMDAASFLASLDPGLRQAVLLEQDEEMLAQLPGDIALEARALGGDRRLNQFMDIARVGRPRALDRAEQPDDQASKKPKPRPVVQMLDKAGVATLLRLMFIPQQGSIRGTLNGVLKDISENRQNRAEIISILLSILQDGTSDVNAIEKSFAHLSLRAKQPGTQKTPQPPKRTLTGQFPINSEISPLTVVQQCLSSLGYLVREVSHMPAFFLTEHETAVGFKSRANRKGKGKDSRANRFPLNALLGLLDRKLIIESSSIMEQLASILQAITTPLTLLNRKEKEKEKTDEQKKAASTQQAASSETQTQAPATGTTDTEMISAQDTQAQSVADASALNAGDNPAAGSNGDGKAENQTDDKSKKPRLLVPPEVPEANLRLVINILAARECSSRTFRDTLSMINNLSVLPGAKEVFGKELVKQAQDLGQAILKDLDDLVMQISKAETSTDVQGMALARFSPASSDQAKLLRVITALDYLFDPKRAGTEDKPVPSSTEGLPAEQKEDILTTLYENPTFGSLWSKLSECLTAIRQRGNMFNVATILLPLIEVLMVVCKNTTLKDAPLSKIHHREITLSSPPPESRMENMFFAFTEEHRKILNDLNSKVLEFDNKRNYFTRRLHHRGPNEIRHSHQPLQLAVRRDQVFLDSFKSLHFRSGDEMKFGKLSIRFQGEEGVDAGGVTREWFQVLSRQMFNPDYALFIPVASDRTTFHPNRLSSVNQEHLMFFKFIGRIIGKALYENRVLDCHFSRAVYKCILGKPVSIKDMETLDLEYYKSLLWILENDITDIITETFSVETDDFGEKQIIDLVENGRNIPVTDENKHEYVRLVVEYKLTGSVKDQLENFLRGFHDIVPAELVSIFDEQELELLISGLPEIDIDDWKNNTEYHNYTAASPQIQWFWRAVRSFDQEEQAKLLQFVTGTSKVPLNGFKELEGMNGFSRFNIHRDYGNKDRLPSSHTCFNQLDLPEYETYEQLRQQVYTAMTAGSEYFGFA